MSLDAALAGAKMVESGEITLEEFSEGIAYMTLVEQGVTNPTVEQVRDRMSELATSASFISAIPAPE